MKATYEELLSGNTQWTVRKDGASVLISYHGYRESSDEFLNHPGIWCYYLMIPQQMYSHRWYDFRPILSQYGYDFNSNGFSHDIFDSEITWASLERYIHHGTEYELTKVGCDYNHLYHSERGFVDTFESVKRDALLTLDKFIKQNPDYKVRSYWSGKWDNQDKFYLAQNGTMIHVDDDVPKEYDYYKPQEKSFL